MGLRITSWNVNGIRNPFQYQPWRDRRSFEAMFDILEADIVIFQETKIQRKDLRDDMVLVPGWDCYWSLPKHKKGYSGVVIYTRNSTCAPIRAEEGITGVLCPPNSSTSFKELPDNEQIGGYPNADQLESSNVDPVTLDSEGRCVILEFPLFVLFGVYSPAMRDETRDDFRLGFVNLLDARIRNLIAQGKRVVLTGDLNIARDERDTPNAEESMRKHGLSDQEYVSTPSRRIFNQLLVDGKVFGDRDAGRETGVMWDLCRGFHPDRKGMYTCWETKINARPGNYGSRIDYVVCSADMKDWFSDANIQEGLMGSDHCPVYAVFKDRVPVDGTPVAIFDVMNPVGMFKEGKRLQQWSTKNLLPTSGKLITEFDRRKNIRDMFSRKPTLLNSESSNAAPLEGLGDIAAETSTPLTISEIEDTVSTNTSQDTSHVLPPSETPVFEKSTSTLKRPLKNDIPVPSPKRAKSGNTGADKNASGKGQKSLKGFFKPKVASQALIDGARDSHFGAPQDIKHFNTTSSAEEETLASQLSDAFEKPDALFQEGNETLSHHTNGKPSGKSPSQHSSSEKVDDGEFIDPIVSKESWSKLFIKPASPRCESHNEPCTSYVTKKPGINCGRSFWLCPRPLGPSGNKERGTQWRCPTFIWASELNGSGSGAGG